jgi:hypothetical protein
MTPTTFNNAIVSVVSAYAETLQQLTTQNAAIAKENELLKQAIKQAIPEGEVLVSKKLFGALREAVLRSYPLEEVAQRAQRLIYETENP